MQNENKSFQTFQRYADITSQHFKLTQRLCNRNNVMKKSQKNESHEEGGSTYYHNRNNVKHVVKPLQLNWFSSNYQCNAYQSDFFL